MQKINCYLHTMNNSIEWVCHRLLEIIVFVTVMQVVLRYGFNNPTSWSEEIAMLCLVWYGMLSIAIGVRTHSHVAITYLRDLLPNFLGIFLDYFSQVVIIVFSVVLIANSYQLVELAGLQVLPASSLPKKILYSAAVVGSVLMLINSVGNVITGNLSETEQGIEND